MVLLDNPFKKGNWNSIQKLPGVGTWHIVSLYLVSSGGGLESNAVYAFLLFNKDTFEKVNHAWMEKAGPLFTHQDLKD